MGWIRIDDHFDEHPKLAKVGPLAWGVWLAGLAYCNRNLTDGFIPWSVARKLAAFEVVDEQGRIWQLARTSGMVGDDVTADWVIELLVRAGLWDEVEGGYQVHDYLDYQPSREQVMKEREQARHRMAATRAARRQGRLQEVRPNIDGTSGEVLANFGGSSDDPNPNPNPKDHRKDPVSPNGDISGETPEGAASSPAGEDAYAKHGPSRQAVEQVMAHFNAVFVPGVFARPLRLTPERARHIKARLQTYSVDELCRAIDNLRQSPFHCGENDRGQVYATPEFLFRNDSQVDKWLNHPPIRAAPAKPARDGQVPDPSRQHPLYRKLMGLDSEEEHHDAGTG